MLLTATFTATYFSPQIIILFGLIWVIWRWPRPPGNTAVLSPLSVCSYYDNNLRGPMFPIFVSAVLRSSQLYNAAAEFLRIELADLLHKYTNSEHPQLWETDKDSPETFRCETGETSETKSELW
jgi:hypothetical protein